MTVKELYDKYMSFETYVEKRNYLEQVIEVKQYLPFLSKTTFAENLFLRTCIKDGQLILNTTMRNYFRDLVLVDKWTNVDIDFKNNLTQQYDWLVSSGLMQEIMGKVPIEERECFERIVEQRQNDAIATRNSFSYVINEQSTRITDLLKTLSSSIPSETIARNAIQFLKNTEGK